MKLRMFAWINARTSSKLGYVGSKTRSIGQILEKPRLRSRGHIFSSILMNVVRLFASRKSRTTLKMGHVGSKTRSLSQILVKNCVRSRGHIFSPILMNLCQNVCLNKFSENGSNLGKTLLPL